MRPSGTRRSAARRAQHHAEQATRALLRCSDCDHELSVPLVGGKATLLCARVIHDAMPTSDAARADNGACGPLARFWKPKEG